MKPSFARNRKPAWPLALAVLAITGCSGHVIPVLTPARTSHVRPGERNQALVVLPNRAVISVHLRFVCDRGRIAIVSIGLVNHHPGKATLFSSKTRVYVDDGEPLRILEFKEFDSEESNIDFHILKRLPKDAAGKWLLMRRRPVTESTLRGPTVVLFYSIDGHDGFVKVPYRAIWSLPG